MALDLFDINKTISDQDKKNLNIQEAVYLGASIFAKRPVPEIIPTELFRYEIKIKKDEDGKLSAETIRVNRLKDSRRRESKYSLLFPLFVNALENQVVTPVLYTAKYKVYPDYSTLEENKIVDFDSLVKDEDTVPLLFVDRESYFRFNEKDSDVYTTYSINPFIIVDATKEDEKTVYYYSLDDSLFATDILKRYYDKLNTVSMYGLKNLFQTEEV